MGEEALAMGVQCVLGPGINMKRTPLCGRNFEYLAEDPTLAASLASAWVSGIQSTGVSACLKHFAANNQETERMQISVEVDEAALRQIYLEAFRRVIAEANPWSVMCSYNRLWGVHASQNRWLLTQVLRDEWGYDGLVMSDWDAVHAPVEAVRAGLDLQMPGTAGRSTKAIAKAIRRGKLSEADVDRSARRVTAFVEKAIPHGRQSVRVVRDTGVTPGEQLPPQLAVVLGMEAHHALAREAAAGAAVLLRNDGALPLKPAASLAVIGAYAVTPRIQGGGSSGVAPTRVDVPLDQIAAVVGGAVPYAPGYSIGATDYYRENEPPVCDADVLRAEAVAIANRADVVVAFVGLRIADESEGSDRSDLALPAAQASLLNELAGLGKPLVVVLAAGSPVVMDESWHDRTSAILLMHLGGQAVGGAVADLLFGRANPSGKLAETWPMSLADTPGISTFPGVNGQVHYDEGTQIGYRWYDAKGLPVRYPFGYGLSYTTFAYSDLQVVPGDSIEVSVTVQNTGSMAGAEVVQVYAGGDASPVLVGFAKVWLMPGASQRIAIHVPLRHLARWRPGDGWTMDAATWRFAVAASSRDIRLTQDVTLPGLRFPV